MADVQNVISSHDETVLGHYTRLANNYDDFLAYSPDFIRRMTSKMVEKLDLRRGDVFVDLGGGTGIYSADILKQVPLRHGVLLVDPVAEMLEKAPQTGEFTCIEMDGMAFSERDDRYDKILIKEAIHHIAEREPFFRNLFARLSPGGRVLLVHVPPELDYPLFRGALDRAREWHANPDKLETALAGAGFAVEREGFDYRHRLPKEVYLRMAANRYMSLLSSFDEDELRDGLAEMEATYRDRAKLDFTDHFDFITGVKPGA